jgi:hypothetical protein
VDEDNAFGVVINGLQIPAEKKKKIAIEIRKTVLEELATMDLKGDLTVKKSLKGQEFLSRIGPTDGIFAEFKQE